VKVCQRFAPSDRRGLLDLLLQVLEHRLQCADDEWQADEGERDPDADRREAHLERQPAADPAVARVQRRQRDAGDSGGQGERQVDERIDEAPAGKLVAHQHPADEQAEDGVDRRRQERGAEGEPVRGDRRARS
jgi:hypothetical protein